MPETIQTVDEGFSWIESYTNYEETPAGATREFRLDRMARIVESFGNPQNSFKVIHTAGSKGKGSTSAFIASGLSARGFTTGLYTSPHVSDYRERISLAGKEIPEEVYLKSLREIFNRMQKLSVDVFPGSGEPTTFELLTLLAFMVFRSMNCDWVVLETGMGGRLDATNIVQPEVTVITNIELEHTRYLGDTIGLIAAEKGGIIKEGVPLFGGRLVPEAVSVIRKIAAGKNAPFKLLDEEAVITGTGEKSETTRVEWKDKSISEWHLKMTGPHQGENAALAALVLNNLPDFPASFSGDQLCRALESTRLPGRMERFNLNGSVWILDGAHTPASLKHTVETFRSRYGSDGILLFGSSREKPLAPLAEETAGAFHDIILTRAGDFKPEDPQKIHKAFQAVLPPDQNLHLVPDPLEAHHLAEELSERKRPVLVTGSFYMVGEIRPRLLSPA